MSFPRSSRARRLIAVVVALTFVVAACGDDSESTSTADTTSTTMAAHDDSGDQAAGHAEPVDVSDLDPVPTVAIEVTEDPMAGWNLHLETTGHAFAPEHVSTEHVPGEGHAHLYIDGEKVTRLYAEDFFLGELSTGEHEITVELSANNHGPLAVDGSIVEDTVVVDVPEGTEAADDAEADHGHDDVGAGDEVDAAAADVTIDLTVAGGAVSGQTGRQQIAVGDTVLIRVASDVADEVHVHGYDVLTEVGAGATAEIQFTADVPGVFEVELEGAGLLLVELAVS